VSRRQCPDLCPPHRAPCSVPHQQLLLEQRPALLLLQPLEQHEAPEVALLPVEVPEVALLPVEVPEVALLPVEVPEEALLRAQRVPEPPQWELSAAVQGDPST
jgi:hypothetical protein